MSSSGESSWQLDLFEAAPSIQSSGDLELAGWVGAAFAAGVLVGFRVRRMPYSPIFVGINLHLAIMTPLIVGLNRLPDDPDRKSHRGQLLHCGSVDNLYHRLRAHALFARGLYRLASTATAINRHLVRRDVSGEFGVDHLGAARRSERVLGGRTPDYWSIRPPTCYSQTC